MTPEQEKQVEGIRATVQFGIAIERTVDTNEYEPTDWFRDCRLLFDKIDDLQSQLLDAKRLNPDGVYVIFFEDQSTKPEFFGGPGALHGATERHKQLSQMWACHIFSQISNREKATKQYTLAELRDAFNAVPFESLFPKGEYAEGKIALNGWLECARFLGAIKEEVA